MNCNMFLFQVFIQNSKFAALGIEDDGGSGEDGDIECP